jgi:hypothetical protein
MEYLEPSIMNMSSNSEQKVEASSKCQCNCAIRSQSGKRRYKLKNSYNKNDLIFKSRNFDQLTKNSNLIW